MMEGMQFNKIVSGYIKSTHLFYEGQSIEFGNMFHGRPIHSRFECVVLGFNHGCSHSNAEV